MTNIMFNNYHHYRSLNFLDENNTCPICSDYFDPQRAPDEGMEREDVSGHLAEIRCPGTVRNQVGHIFHRACLSQWFNQDNAYGIPNRSCPTCRSEVRDEESLRQLGIHTRNNGTQRTFRSFHEHHSHQTRSNNDLPQCCCENDDQLRGWSILASLVAAMTIIVFGLLLLIAGL